MVERMKTRTNFFSNPAVQGKILMVAFLSAVLLIGTCWVMSLRALDTAAKAAASLSVSSEAHSDIALLFAQQRSVLITQLAVYSLVSFVLVSLAALFVSHNIGGPLHHLVTYCRGVVKGDVEPRAVKFREHDIPHDVADAFNEFQRHHGIIKPDSDKKDT